MSKGRPACNARLVSYDVSEAVWRDDSSGGSRGWRVVGRGDAHFERSAWLKAVEQLIFNPEHSSSSILRADIDLDTGDVEGEDIEEVEKYTCVRLIRRTILPRRPNLDRSLKQDCLVYESETGILVILRPLLHTRSKDEIPYYHPQVLALAFRYEHQSVEVLILPFPQDSKFDPVAEPQHRLSRTVLALIGLQCKLAWGAENGYKKRVEHDVLVSRSDYQALYIDLRVRYAKKVMENWAESTDPKKHVFEDLGIAAFIMLLWRDSFPDDGQNSRWGRPECFVDVGCGNGLLVYLLTCEGYSGFGIDVQTRKSWSVYAKLNNNVDLRTGSVDPSAIVRHQQHHIPPNAFLIGNHADELTPWIPLLAHCLDRCLGFINIPCCRFQLDGNIFDATRYIIDDSTLTEMLGDGERYYEAVRQIARGPPAEKDTRSRNIAYLRYIDHLHLQAGWQIEKEALRIPSTKNWAIVGRRRTWDGLTGPTAEKKRKFVDSDVASLALQNESNWRARATVSSIDGKSHH